MLGRSILASRSLTEDRVFVYEIAGLRQTDQSDQNSPAIRSSGRMMMQVPFNRMGEFMQHIQRSGGNIVGIYKPNEGVPASSQETSEE